MDFKKWIKIWFYFILLFTLMVGLFNYIVDPFQQYRKSSFYNVFFADERYLNPGLAKNYPYRSVVVGSSMTENFLISNLKKIMQDPIKLCMSGGSANEIRITLNTVFAHKKPKTILIGLDMYAISGDKFRQRFGQNSLPQYLYNNNLLDDYKYLLSTDIILKSMKMFFKKTLINDIGAKYENMYQWQHHFINNFGKEKVLKQWANRKKNFNTDFKKSDWELEKLTSSFDYNILQLIKNNPDTKFIIFFPPYSVLAYVDWIEKDLIQNIMKVKKHVVVKSLTYKNVEIYDFQIDKKITTNLDDYKDLTHYHQRINGLMVDFMKNKSSLHKITIKNFEEKNKIFKDYIYDYYDENIKRLYLKIKAGQE